MCANMGKNLKTQSVLFLLLFLLFRFVFFDFQDRFLCVSWNSQKSACPCFPSAGLKVFATPPDFHLIFLSQGISLNTEVME